MRTIIPFILILAFPSLFISCASDDEFPGRPENFNPVTDDYQPTNPGETLVDPKPPSGAYDLPGFPKTLKKYENGNLNFWANYYYSPDGNLMQVNYGYGNTSNEIFSNIYHYSGEGKLRKLEGHDVYDYYWEKDQIVEADRYNGMWSGRSKIYFQYNNEGQIVQRLEINIDFNYSEKIIYTYFEDGNLKSIEQYGDNNNSGRFIKYFVTTYSGYTKNKNLFIELEIIPGLAMLQDFPTAMDFKHLTETGYNQNETYEYKFDAEGRVIQRKFGNNKIDYQYY